MTKSAKAQKASKPAKGATLAPIGESPIKPPVDGRPLKTVKTVLHTALTQEERKARRAAAKEAAIKGPTAKAKGGQKPSGIAIEGTTSIGEKRKAEQAKQEAADTLEHAEVREAGLTAKAVALTSEYLSIHDKEAGLSNRVVQFAVDCMTLRRFEIAMADAYEDVRNRKGSTAPEVIPGGLRNLKSIVTWAIKEDELLEEDGETVRTYYAIKQLKAQKLQNAKSKPSANEDGEEKVSASEQAAEKFGCNDLADAFKGIADLNTIANGILKGLESGDTLAMAKARILMNCVEEAARGYGDAISALAAPTPMVDAMASGKRNRQRKAA
jgi:hypothetical protein